MDPNEKNQDSFKNLENNEIENEINLSKSFTEKKSNINLSNINSSHSILNQNFNIPENNNYNETPLIIINNKSNPLKINSSSNRLIKKSDKNSTNKFTRSTKSSAKDSHRVSVLDIYNDPSKFFDIDENDDLYNKLVETGNRMSNIISKVEQKSSLKTCDHNLNTSSYSLNSDSINITDISDSALTSISHLSDDTKTFDEKKMMNDELIINNLINETNNNNKRATVSLVHKLVIETQQQEKKEEDGDGDDDDDSGDDNMETNNKGKNSTREELFMR